MAVKFSKQVVTANAILITCCLQKPSCQTTPCLLHSVVRLSPLSRFRRTFAFFEETSYVTSRMVSVGKSLIICHVSFIFKFHFVSTPFENFILLIVAGCVLMYICRLKEAQHCYVIHIICKMRTLRRLNIAVRVHNIAKHRHLAIKCEVNFQTPPTAGRTKTRGHGCIIYE